MSEMELAFRLRRFNEMSVPRGEMSEMELMARTRFVRFVANSMPVRSVMQYVQSIPK